jgi:hypothetical protein
MVLAAPAADGPHLPVFGARSLMQVLKYLL